LGEGSDLKLKGVWKCLKFLDFVDFWKRLNFLGIFGVLELVENVRIF
jgi:hypothetical protein